MQCIETIKNKLLKRFCIKDVTVSGRPIFVVGPPRSGTTFLQRLLNAHPKVLLTNETAIFLQLSEIIKKSNQGVTSGVWYGKEYNQLWAEVVREAARDLIATYYRRIAEAEKKTELLFWGDKHPHYYNCLDFIVSLYPQAMFIMCVRDPRDVALSISKMNCVTIEQSVFTTSIIFKRYHEFFDRHQTLKPYLVFYEKMVTEPEAVLRNLFAFFRLPWCECVVKALDSFRTKDAHGITDEPRDYSHNFGKWRSAFSPYDILRAREILGCYIESYGYSW